MDAIASILQKKLDPNSESFIKAHSDEDRCLKLEGYTGDCSPKDLLECIRQLEKVCDYRGFD